MAPRSPRSTARITVDFGYDIHTLQLSPRTLRKIQAGAVLSLRGPGFLVDGVREQDRWVFNSDAVGRLIVVTDEGREIYDGQITDGEVRLEQGGSASLA